MEKWIVRRVLCGELEENAYLVCPESRDDAFLVDPGDDFDALSAALRRSGRRLTHILLTHGHFDHILCAPRLRAVTGAKIVIHREDAPLLQDAALNVYNPVFCREAFSPFAADVLLDGGEENTLCGIRVQVLHTPGHTPGGVSYYLPEHKTLFTGDTLFDGGYGRTDLPGGNDRALFRSLQALAKYPGETMVYSGHGEAAQLVHAAAFLR